MTWARFHAVATVAWALLLIPSVLWWQESVPWLVIMSVWANLASHWGAFQAAKSQTDSSD
jgi:hypothetical protein